MLQDQEDLLEFNVPLVFADGVDTYAEFAKEYVTHETGFFILGPSGIGKSYFVRGQKPGERHWIDADQLWRKAKAMPLGAWWEKVEDIVAVEQRCDIITAEAKKQGFWLLGASCNWLKPDAIVVPDWEVNVGYIREREKNYDGGITSDRLPQLQSHREEILGWEKQGVPKFTSVADAVEHFHKIYDEGLK